MRITWVWRNGAVVQILIIRFSTQHHLRADRIKTGSLQNIGILSNFNISPGIGIKPLRQAPDVVGNSHQQPLIDEQLKHEMVNCFFASDTNFLRRGCTASKRRMPFSQVSQF